MASAPRPWHQTRAGRHPERGASKQRPEGLSQPHAAEAFLTPPGKTEHSAPACTPACLLHPSPTKGSATSHRAPLQRDTEDSLSKPRLRVTRQNQTHKQLGLQPAFLNKTEGPCPLGSFKN